MAKETSWAEEVGRITEEIAPYENMPLPERMSALSRLKDKKRELEKGLKNTDFHIMALELMPDVAEQRVLDDKLALAFLSELRVRGDIAYRTFVDGRPKYYKSLTTRYLFLLHRAKLVELPSDPTFPNGMDNIIKLTERGRTLQYAEPD